MVRESTGTPGVGAAVAVGAPDCDGDAPVDSVAVRVPVCVCEAVGVAVADSGVDVGEDVTGGRHTVVSDVGAGPVCCSWLMLKPCSKLKVKVTAPAALRMSAFVGVTTMEMVLGVPAVATICAGVRLICVPQFDAPTRLLTHGL